VALARYFSPLRIAGELGIDEVHADVLPGEKADLIP